MSLRLVFFKMFEPTSTWVIEASQRLSGLWRIYSRDFNAFLVIERSAKRLAEFGNIGDNYDR